MADVAVHHGVADVYEPSLFGTYSKKIGMWLFLLSDSLTFGALLWAYTYGRVSTPNWPTPFHSESIRNATIMTAFLLTSSLTMVLAVRASVDRKPKQQLWYLLATMACGLGFVILHGREWTNLIAEGLTLPVFPAVPGQSTSSEFSDVAKTVPQFAATFFGLGWSTSAWWRCARSSSPSFWDCGSSHGSRRQRTARFTTGRTFC